MDLTPYVDSLRRDLAAVAEAAGADVTAALERLAPALDPAVRLAMMEAVSQAAAEITAEMAQGGVDVRLSGRDLEFTVHAVETDSAPPPGPAPSPTGSPDEDGSVARITLRVPEAVKGRAEELAARSGHSLNTWVVNVIRAATRDPAFAGRVGVDLDLSSIPFVGGDPFPGRARGRRRMTGWI